MSKQPLLNESTQRRMLLLAGMSHFADEVIAESKKDGLPAEPDYAGGIKDAKGAKGSKGSKKEACAEDDKKKLLEELPQDDLEAAPSAPAPAPALEAPEGAPATPDVSSGDLELEKFAQEFAKFLSSQGHQIVLTVDGKDMASAGEEDDFGGEADFGEVDEAPPSDEGEFEAPAEETPEEAPPEEESAPKFESKEKVVAKLVYEEVLKTLTKNAGINLEQARKNGSVKLQLPDSSKKKTK